MLYFIAVLVLVIGGGAAGYLYGQKVRDKVTTDVATVTDAAKKL